MTSYSPLIRLFSGGSDLAIVSYGLSCATPSGFFDSLPGLHLDKFKATLTPAETERDIDFRPDPGAASHRGHLYRW